MQDKKSAKKQKAFAVIEKFIPRSFRLQSKQSELILDQNINYKRLSLLAFCVTEMIYLGPRPYFLTLRFAYNSWQVKTNIEENCYILVAFFIGYYCAPAP